MQSPASTRGDMHTTHSLEKAYTWPIKPLPRIKTRLTLDEVTVQPRNLNRSFAPMSGTWLLKVVAMITFVFALASLSGSIVDTATHSYGNGYSSQRGLQGLLLDGELKAKRHLRETSGSNVASGLEQNDGSSATVLYLDQEKLDMRSAPACLSTPAWALPEEEAQKLPYLNLENDLDALLQQQTQLLSTDSDNSGADDQAAVVTVLYFSVTQGIKLHSMIQNLVTNIWSCKFIVATWDQRSLDICKELNLPCFDASSLLPTSFAAISSPVSWIKPALSSEILDRGIAVYAAIIETARPQKSTVDDTYRYLSQVGADAAFSIVTNNETPIQFTAKSDTYLVLPTAGGKKLTRHWLLAMSDSLQSWKTDERVLGDLLQTSSIFSVCTQAAECAKIKASRPDHPLIRRTSSRRRHYS